MHPSDAPSSQHGGKPSSWKALADWLAQLLSRKSGLLEEFVADRVKDTLLDLGYDPEEDDELEPASPVPLPPLEVEPFIAGLNGPVSDALRRVAEVVNDNQVNENPHKIEQQVRSIFDDLARTALLQAYELRLAAFEADLPPPGHGADWARKYRRMMASEGRRPLPLE
jgi:hypothetical protein